MALEDAKGSLSGQFLDSALHKAQKAINEASLYLSDNVELGAAKPGIVVVGIQSSGKSALLSRLAGSSVSLGDVAAHRHGVQGTYPPLSLCSGVELPTGDSLCTRCPLQLELQRCDDDHAPFARVSYQPAGGARVENKTLQISEIAAAVKEAQSQLAGPASDISSAVIRLEVFSPEAPVGCWGLGPVHVPLISTLKILKRGLNVSKKSLDSP